MPKVANRIFRSISSLSPFAQAVLPISLSAF